MPRFASAISVIVMLPSTPRSSGADEVCVAKDFVYHQEMISCVFMFGILEMLTGFWSV